MNTPFLRQPKDNGGAMEAVVDTCPHREVAPETWEVILANHALVMDRDHQEEVMCGRDITEQPYCLCAFSNASMKAVTEIWIYITCLLQYDDCDSLWNSFLVT